MKRAFFRVTAVLFAIGALQSGAGALLADSDGRVAGAGATVSAQGTLPAPSAPKLGPALDPDG